MEDIDTLVHKLTEFYSVSAIKKAKDVAEDLALAEALYCGRQDIHIFFQQWQRQIYAKLYTDALSCMTQHPNFKPDMDCMHIQLCYSDFICYLQEKYDYPARVIE